MHCYLVCRGGQRVVRLAQFWDLEARTVALVPESTDCVLSELLDDPASGAFDWRVVALLTDIDVTDERQAAGLCNKTSLSAEMARFSTRCIHSSGVKCIDAINTVGTLTLRVDATRRCVIVSSLAIELAFELVTHTVITKTECHDADKVQLFRKCMQSSIDEALVAEAFDTELIGARRSGRRGAGLRRRASSVRARARSGATSVKRRARSATASAKGKATSAAASAKGKATSAAASAKGKATSAAASAKGKATSAAASAKGKATSTAARAKTRVSQSKAGRAAARLRPRRRRRQGDKSDSTSKDKDKDKDKDGTSSSRKSTSDKDKDDDGDASSSRKSTKPDKSKDKDGGGDGGDNGGTARKKRGDDGGSGAADKAKTAAGKAKDAASSAKDKAKDTAGDAASSAKGAAGDVADKLSGGGGDAGGGGGDAGVPGGGGGDVGGAAAGGGGEGAMMGGAGTMGGAGMPQPAVMPVVIPAWVNPQPGLVYQTDGYINEFGEFVPYRPAPPGWSGPRTQEVVVRIVGDGDGGEFFDDEEEEPEVEDEAMPISTALDQWEAQRGSGTTFVWRSDDVEMEEEEPNALPSVVGAPLSDCNFGGIMDEDDGISMTAEDIVEAALRACHVLGLSVNDADDALAAADMDDPDALYETARALIKNGLSQCHAQ